MYKLTDYVTEIQISGLDPIYDDKTQGMIGRGPGSMLVTYNNGPQSRFALKAKLDMSIRKQTCREAARTALRCSKSYEGLLMRQRHKKALIEGY